MKSYSCDKSVFIDIQRVVVKRLFFGFEVDAPWPDQGPEGRLIPPESRHLTLAFLGNIDENTLDLSKIPLPEGKIGSVAKASSLAFFERVVAYSLEALDPSLLDYQKALAEALGIVDDRRYHGHVSLARAPFDKQAWEAAFEPVPVLLGSLHLYESLGNFTYPPIWTHELVKPFEEIEHTADVAFLVRGKDLSQLGYHASFALSFAFPEFLPYCEFKQIVSFEALVSDLNRMVTRADIDVGSPVKAVSFAGHAHEIEAGILEWEMIVDI